MLYFIGYVLFLNNLNNIDDDNNDDTKNTFINIYLAISLILSFYLIYYYSNLYKNDNNFIHKIVYSYLILTCILNIIGLSIILLSDEYNNNNLNKIKISNNIFKYSFAFVIIFTISNVFGMIYYYFYNNNYINEQKINFTMKIFSKYLKSIEHK
jgi:hypothetical protein